MTLYALAAVDDAIATTKAFLWPVDRGKWARLALIVFFLGGAGSGFSPFQFNTPPSSGTGGEFPGSIPEITPGLLVLLGAIIAGVILIGVLFLLVGSIMEFVFVESLRRDTVQIRNYWRRDWRLGMRLFGFRLVIGLATFGVIGGLAVIALAPLLFDSGSFSLGLVAFAVLTFVIVSIISGLLTGFTTVFIVPIMLLDRCGVLAAWRRFWPTMITQWEQYAAYAVLGFILQLVGGMVAGILSLIIGIGLIIPFGLVGLIGAGLLVVSQVAGWIVIGIVAVLYVLALIISILLITVPIQTYLRYYALLVLGDTNDAFDIIPEQRTAVRE